MLAFPICKINLGLYITERRADHFHNLLTCFYPVQWNDILEIVPQMEFEFVQTGLQVGGKPEENLCLKAYQLLKKDYSLPHIRLHLHKIIPMGAGLGGGSSDAAFLLKTLNETFELNIEEPKLENYAARLGSDCAFFVRNRPVIASGRGEVMQDFDLDLKGTHILVIYPAVHVSTADAFGGVKPRAFEVDFAQLLSDSNRWKFELHNQFEETIFPKYPKLNELKQELYNMGAWYAAMSGSGSAIFGLFGKEPPENHFQFETYRGTL